MLKFKLFKWFTALVLIFGILSAIFGIWVINQRVVQEAQTAVRHDLSSAWAVYQSQLGGIETVVKLVATRTPLIDACNARNWDDRPTWDEVEGLLAKHRLDFKLDFLTIVSADGRVVARGGAPGRHGDWRNGLPLIAKALAGDPASGTVLLSQEQLALEADGLVQQAFLPLQETPHARPAATQAEERGMVFLAAAPIEKNGRVIGAIYGGSLLNRNLAFVDRVQNIVFGSETYNGIPRGTTTLFLGDTRVATTVRLPNGNRALGTRVSKEVADTVLDNGGSWAGPAMVLEEPCLTAYDPIRDSEGKVIGMLYVGTLERPFRDLSRGLIVQYAALIAAALVVALLMAGFIAGRIARPLHRLAAGADKMRHGQGFVPVPPAGGCNEITGLIQAFNEMAATLTQREEQLKDANERLAATNSSLKATNSSYMETLQFVSHELNSPLSSTINYVYLLRQRLLGALTEKQENAADIMTANLKRILEMIRHYLNLARIESGEIQPVPTRVAVREEVIAPTLAALQADIHAKNLSVEDLVPPRVILHTDLNMTREVFDNLLGNAVKYSPPGGRITLQCRPDGKFAAFSIRNQGDGIPPERHGELFQKFSRLEIGESKKTQRGTGLGLFICKKIVESHGGDISVDSLPGQWTEFRARLPLAQEIAPAEPKPLQQVHAP